MLLPLTPVLLSRAETSNIQWKRGTDRSSDVYDEQRSAGGRRQLYSATRQEGGAGGSEEASRWNTRYGVIMTTMARQTIFFLPTQG